ncbi:unnamed protein product, partial [Mesorhabditis spiculigera]
MDDPGPSRREPFIKVQSFLDNRLSQIAELTSASRNDSLVKNEVTRGPRTALQRMPRHMRRRAMSYDSRRFPRLLRCQALKTKKKIKSPRHLRRRYQLKISRGKKIGWLETHLWHAKRHEMCTKWGRVIAEKCYQRGFRSTFRAIERFAAVHDISYTQCFQLTTTSGWDGGPGPLIDGLLKICRLRKEELLETIPGKFEAHTELFHPVTRLSYGPARISIHRADTGSSLVIWVHPAAAGYVKDLLNEIYNLESPEKAEIQLHDLKGEFCRFRLFGPMALATLRAAFVLANPAEASKYRDNHAQWEAITDSDRLADGSIISLLVQDVRVAIPARRTSPILQQQGHDEASRDGCTASVVPDVYDADEREKARAARISDGQLNADRGKAARQLAAKSNMPVLIVRLGAAERRGILSGFDIIAPRGFARDIWRALQMRNCRSMSLRDYRAAHLEIQAPYFPEDCVDFVGYKELAREDTLRVETRYSARPPHERSNFVDLGVPFPFCFEWELLWKELMGHQEFRVPRQFYLYPKPNDCLLPIRILMLAGSLPEKFSLICAPNLEEKRRILQGDRSLTLEEVPRKKKKLAGAPEKPIPVRPKDPLSGFVELDVTKKEQNAPIRPLFGLSRTLTKKNASLLELPKKADTQRKVAEKGAAKKTEEEGKEDKPRPYHSTCSRTIIGRVVRGGRSQSTLSGVGYGYVPYKLFKQLPMTHDGAVAWIRTNNSVHYHLAKLTIDPAPHIDF